VVAASELHLLLGNGKNFFQLVNKPSLLALFGIMILSMCSFLPYEDDERVITSQPLLSGDEKLGVAPWTRVER